jgi:hypothetical protein
MTEGFDKVSDVFFRYTDKQVEAVCERLPSVADRGEIVCSMERAAEFYRFSIAMEKTGFGHQRRRDAEGLAQSLGSTLAHLSMVKQAWGFEGLGLSETQGSQLLRQLMKLRETANTISRLGPVPALVPQTKKHKTGRRLVVEHAAILWWTIVEDTSHAVTSPMLDFVEVAVRPILVLGDQFNTDPVAGRDALGKVIDTIRSEGMIMPFVLYLAREEGNS